MESNCILQCGKPCEAKDSIDSIATTKWNNIRTKSEIWKGLDRFNSVYDTVVWEDGPVDRYMHSSCYLTLCNTKKLEQAKIRNQKALDDAVIVDGINNINNVDNVVSPPPKRRRSAGSLHDKSKCVWCFTGLDTKHPDRKSSKLHIISSRRAWSVFKKHTVLLEDDEMRARLVTLIDFIDSGTDPFAVEVRYHHKCWQKYVSHPVFSEVDHLHLQNVSLVEAKSLFFRHVEKVIFQEHEIRTLQSLLVEYKTIMENYNHNAFGVKSSFLKTLLIREFDGTIGFHIRSQKNESEEVYDKGNGGSMRKRPYNRWESQMKLW